MSFVFLFSINGYKTIEVGVKREGMKLEDKCRRLCKACVVYIQKNSGLSFNEFCAEITKFNSVLTGHKQEHKFGNADALIQQMVLDCENGLDKKGKIVLLRGVLLAVGVITAIAKKEKGVC